MRPANDAGNLAIFRTQNSADDSTTEDDLALRDGTLITWHAPPAFDVALHDSLIDSAATERNDRESSAYDPAEIDPTADSSSTRDATTRVATIESSISTRY